MAAGPMTINAKSDAIAVAALSVAAAMGELLEEKGIFTKAELTELYSSLARAKAIKGAQPFGETEAEASKMLEHMAQQTRDRL